VWIVRWTFIAIILIVILGFSLQNTQLVEISVLGWQSGEIPIYLVIYFAFAAGVLVFLLVAAFHQFQQRAEVRRCRREIKRLEGELDRLRIISIEEGLDERPDETGGEDV